MIVDAQNAERVVESPSLAEQILAAVARVRVILEGEAANVSVSAPVKRNDSPLARLASKFRLSDFEVETLIFCAAAELDPQFPALLEAASSAGALRYPTFQLLLKIVPHAHWTALLPHRPLRRWNLIDFRPEENLTACPLHIDESVLHFLMGAATTDTRLHGLLENVNVPSVLPPSYRAHAERIIEQWTAAGESRVVIQLSGNARKGKSALAAGATAAANFGLRRISAESIPESTAARDALLRLLERDATLNEYALLIDADGCDRPAWNATSYLADRFDGMLLVSAGRELSLTSREVANICVDKPTNAEQASFWRSVLGEMATPLNGELDRLATQFSMEFEAIAGSAKRVLREHRSSDDELPNLLWNSCRAESRPALDHLAQRIETTARWQDLVLPEACMETLRTVVFHMRQRDVVMHRWGFAERCSRGLGTAALFHGPSGSGKTLTAEILASELSLDLFRIDLSQVVSKYIGDTEKNLRQVFDAAENSGAILLFDEADALFGKRSEVRDSHDRYANIEVSYLLQRMEAYQGLAILTTNIRAALDSAFLRRIRFVVHFPFPDAPLRRRIWEQMFPAKVPTRGLNFDKLARLNLPGGNIRNIALNAAFVAAEKGIPVGMQQLLSAARQECQKLERPVSEAEVGGWV